MRNKESGFTAVELLISVAIIGVLSAVAFVRINPPSSRLLANDVKAMVHQARYEAVKQNRPVAFFWDSASAQFQIRQDSASSTVASTCAGNTVLTRKAVSDYPNTNVVVRVPTSGIVWLPTGQARTCTGAPMVNSVIQISDVKNTRVVNVTMGGKVTIE